jgi:hypothetical protein
MRKILLFTSILLMCATWAVAQQSGNAPAPSASSPNQQASPGAPSTSESQQASPNSPSTSDQASQPSPGENSIEGCLGGSAGNYTIIDKAGTSYKLDLPANADTSVLDKHIGEEVRVSGAVANASGSGSSQNPPSASAGGASASQASIKVTHISKVAATCTTNTGANSSK